MGERKKRPDRRHDNTAEPAQGIGPIHEETGTAAASASSGGPVPSSPPAPKPAPGGPISAYGLKFKDEQDLDDYDPLFDDVPEEVDGKDVP